MARGSRYVSDSASTVESSKSDLASVMVASSSPAKGQVDSWWKRLVESKDPKPGDSTAVTKSSVRCWGMSEGNTAYLLTTHSSGNKTLESKTKFIRNRLDAYLKRTR